jgi:hypothetical protein
VTRLLLAVGAGSIAPTGLGETALDRRVRTPAAGGSRFGKWRHADKRDLAAGYSARECQADSGRSSWWMMDSVKSTEEERPDRAQISRSSSR